MNARFPLFAPSAAQASCLCALLSLPVFALPSSAAPSQPPATKPGSSPAFSAATPATWIAERAPHLAIRKRTLDPFARLKDPADVPPPPKPGETPVHTGGAGTPEATIDTKAEFTQAVSSIKVSMVGNGMFFFNGRPVRQGETISLTTPSGRKCQATVLSISSAAISFKDSKSGVKATKSLFSLPKGMTPAGQSRALAPGMTPTPPSSR